MYDSLTQQRTTTAPAEVGDGGHVVFLVVCFVGCLPSAIPTLYPYSHLCLHSDATPWFCSCIPFLHFNCFNYISLSRTIDTFHIHSRLAILKKKHDNKATQLFFHPLAMKTLISTLIIFLPSLTLASSRPARYSVRKISSNLDKNDEQRHLFDLTFSDEGVDYEMPPFSLNLSPTAGSPLDNDSLRAIEIAMKDFLLDKLSDDFDGLTGVSVTVLSSEAITTRRRKLANGNQVEIGGTLKFEGATQVPSDAEIQANTDESLSDMDTFLNDYLAVEAANAPQLQSVTSVVSLSSTTLAPTSPPSAAPTKDNTNFSQANKAISNQDDSKAKGLWPAAVVAVVAFALTILFIAHRRGKIVNVNDSFDQESVDSVDYGDNTDGIEVGFKERKQQQKSCIGIGKSQYLDGNVDKMRTVESVPVDHNTTIHIPPVTNSSSRVYDSDPMVLSAASSVGSSFDDQDYTSHMLGMFPSASTEQDDISDNRFYKEV